MKIYAMDVATKTGWALCEWNGSTLQATGVLSGVIQAEGDSPENKSHSFAVKMMRLFKTHGLPDWVVFEQPLRNVVAHKRVKKDMFGKTESAPTINASTAILLNQFVGAGVGMLAALEIGTNRPIKWAVVPPQTWRALFFGKGVKPAEKSNWKKLAREHCAMRGFDVSNDDQAEAVGILHWAVNGFDQIRYERLMQDDSNQIAH